MPQFVGSLNDVGHKTFDLQLERLIALLRIAFAAYCWLNFASAPTLAAPRSSIFELMLAAYSALALNIALVPFFGTRRGGWQLPAHILDVAAVATSIYFLKELSGPFVLLFVFALLSATIRWNWRGALWTTAVLLVVQSAVFVTTGTSTQFLLQYTFLSVVGGIFAFFGATRDHAARRLRDLATWPGTAASTRENDAWLDASLAHVASVLNVPRVLVVWEIIQEPYWYSALYADGRCEKDRNPTNRFGNLVALPLSELTFASDSIGRRECLTAEGHRKLLDPVLNEAFQKRYEILSLCSAPLAGEICKGRVFMLDRSEWTDDDLRLAEVVGSRLCIELEHYALGGRVEASAANRERMRLARDLHDGILQTLAAAGLQLKTLATRLEPKSKQAVEAVRGLLLTEQQRLRAFVDGRQPLNPQLVNLQNALLQRLEKIKRQWGCDYDLFVKPEGSTVSPKLCAELEYILDESVANAMRHGHASHIDVAIEQVSDELRIEIADNGRGFVGAAGSYSETELLKLEVAPRSISKRVHELGGTLSLSSQSTGATLHIMVPTQQISVNQAYQNGFSAHAYH